MGKMVDGKVALVTGAASGIGQASAVLFAQQGASAVVVADVNGDGLAVTSTMVTGAGAECLAVTADLTAEDEVAALMDAAVDRFGRLDAAHNNAGITDPAMPFHEMPESVWDRMIAVNLTSVFFCMKHEFRVMLPNGSGAIVNTSSGAGVIGAPGIPHYVAAKHGVLGLTKTGAVEYTGQGIRVNAVCPGNTDTPMMQSFLQGNPELEKFMKNMAPAGEFGRPQEVAEAVVWLCSDHASWVSGESMLVDGATVCR